MTRIEHVIVIEGPPEESWPASKVLRQHVDSLKTELEKTPGLTLLHQWAADASHGGSPALKVAKLAGNTVKSGLKWLFEEEKRNG